MFLFLKLLKMTNKNFRNVCFFLKNNELQLKSIFNDHFDLNVKDTIKVH